MLMWKCTQCGNSNRDSNNYCVRCGAAKGRAHMNNRQQQRSRSQAPLLIVILASVIVVSVLALLLLKGIPTRSAPGSEAAVLPGGGIVQLFLSENGKTILALRQDGRVTPVPISGIAEDSLSAPLAKTAEWTEITALARCWGWILGLRADGTAVAAPTNNIAAYAESAPDLYRTELEKQQQTLAQLVAWHDVVKVVSGVRYAVGIRADGTVATFGEDPAEIHGGPFFSELSRWTDIKKIEVGAWPAGEYCVGLRNDGTLLVCGSVIDSAGWTGPTEHIADFDCSGIRMAVLTEEGRILDGYLGSNGVVVEEPFKESGFRQVVICRGPVGLRPDGTLASSQPELAALADVERIEARHNNGNSLLTVYHHDGSAALPFFREDDVISEAGGWTDLASLCLHDDFAIQGRDGKPGPQHYILGLRKDGSVVSAGIDFAALYSDALSYFAPPEAVSPAALPQQDAGSPVVETPETFELLPIDTVYSDSGKFALEPGWSDQPIAYSYAMPQVAGIFADSARINAEIRALLNDYNYISTAPKNTHILHSQGREIPFSDYLPYETVNETGNIYIVNMDWHAEQFGRILSVRVSTRLYGYGKWVEPETVRSWCLDMDTGLLLSGPEILRAVGISQDDFIKMASFAMETQCSAGWQWPAGSPDEESYDEMQRGIRTTLQANSLDRIYEKGIYLFEDGTLGIDAWISDGSAYGYECFLRLVPEKKAAAATDDAPPVPTPAQGGNWDLNQLVYSKTNRSSYTRAYKSSAYYGLMIPYSYNVPQLRFDSEDAASINERILELYRNYVDEYVVYWDGGFAQDAILREMDWEAHIFHDRILSLVVTRVNCDASREYTSYSIFTIDLSTGRSLDGRGLLAQLGIDSAEFSTRAWTSVMERCRDKYDALFFEMTGSHPDENESGLRSVLDNTMLWNQAAELIERGIAVDDSGNLYVVANIDDASAYSCWELVCVTE